jgi:lipoprotein-anchoring transpeptidase ErfK/SrfK
MKYLYPLLLLISLGLGGVARPAQAERQPPPAPTDRHPSLFPSAPTVGPAQPRITVDLSQQQLIAFEGMTPVRAFAVATGDYDHPTIVGEYSVQWKREKIDLIGPDWYFKDVPYVMMFAKPFYIHAAPWRPEFGKPDSHGCVTLAEADAGWLFNWAEVGTPIFISW